MIYLLKCGEFYKIGFTSVSVADRVADLSIGNPMPIEIIDVWEGKWSDEQRLHERLAHKRHRGEWFALSSEDVANLMKRVPTADRPPLKFPPNVKVAVEHIGCPWCANPLYFMGKEDELYCENCDHISMQIQSQMTRTRWKAIRKTIEACAIS